MIAPSGWSARSTKITDKPDPDRGSVSTFPVPSTYVSAAGDQYPSFTAGSWRVSAIELLERGRRSFAMEPDDQIGDGGLVHLHPKESDEEPDRNRTAREGEQPAQRIHKRRVRAQRVREDIECEDAQSDDRAKENRPENATHRWGCPGQAQDHETHDDHCGRHCQEAGQRLDTREQSRGGGNRKGIDAVAAEGDAPIGMLEDGGDSIHQQQARRHLDRGDGDHEAHCDAMSLETEAPRREGEQQVRRQRIDQSPRRECQPGDQRHGRGLEDRDVPAVPDRNEERAAAFSGRRRQAMTPATRYAMPTTWSWTMTTPVRPARSETRPARIAITRPMAAPIVGAHVPFTCTAARRLDFDSPRNLVDLRAWDRTIQAIQASTGGGSRLGSSLSLPQRGWSFRHRGDPDKGAGDVEECGVAGPSY